MGARVGETRRQRDRRRRSRSPGTGTRWRAGPQGGRRTQKAQDLCAQRGRPRRGERVSPTPGVLRVRGSRGVRARARGHYLLGVTGLGHAGLPSGTCCGR